ncbi:MAG: leucine-rich repeat domain-containing protein, partial [Paludibacteraceae bacterium]|nr:leucine-rich repeat domain-containing protein [Paludibacteraceae bacterium]
MDKIVVYYLLHDDHTATVTTKRPGRRAEYRIRELPVNKITILHSIEDELSEKPYSVVAVEDSAFASTNIEEIVLPSSIVRIGKNAFRNCKKMTKCNLGKGPVIKEIGDYAFAYSGISSIYGNRSVKHLGEGAFLQCENLSIVYETIYLKDIGQSAFKNCFHLQQAPLHDGLERIEADAFERCDSLIEVYIPSSVNYIGRNPFAYCHQLKKIVVDANNINYDSRDSCNAIIGRDERNMLKLLSGCHTTKIPKDVQLLGENAFAGCVNLRIIDIPNAVKRIQTGAFLSCSKLESIILPDALEICEDKSWIRWNDVFGNCNNLSMVSLPKSMTYIKREFFKNNKSLKHLYIPNTIVRIDAEAFKKCTELKYVAIPGSVNINESAFDGCDSVVIYTPNQSMFKAMK